MCTCSSTSLVTCWPHTSRQAATCYSVVLTSLQDQDGGGGEGGKAQRRPLSQRANPYLFSLTHRRRRTHTHTYMHTHTHVHAHATRTHTILICIYRYTKCYSTSCQTSQVRGGKYTVEHKQTMLSLQTGVRCQKMIHRPFSWFSIFGTLCHIVMK